MSGTIKGMITMVLLILVNFLTAQSTVNVSIQEHENAPIISKHIYGHFAEHLGRCIYDGIYVGEDSPIPNTDGIRNDIINALIDLKIPNLRWPGGCFADTYHWKDGIGQKSERPKLVNRWWGGVIEDNSFGTHDFLNFCEKIGAEPYLAANVGSGEVQELSDWVEYVNLEGGSPMAELRKANGREKPWNVTYWGVGNEMWGCGGNMTAEFYANVYRQYATFMSDWSNTNGLYRIASGANQGDYHWTEVLMRDIPKNMIEGVALHSYSVIDWGNKGSATDFTEEMYFTTMKRAWRMEELVTKHSAIMDEYDPRGRVDLIVDEWGGWYDVEPGTNGAFLFQQNTMRDAMIAGITLNIFNNHAKRVKMANIAQTVNVLQAVILTEGNKMILTPTYHVMKMYNVHQDAKLLPVMFESPSYEMGDDKIPALSVSASRDASDKVHISATNIDAKKGHKLEMRIDDLGISQISGVILQSENLQDHNTFENPDKIAPKAFTDFNVSNGKLTVNIPAFSVVVLEGGK